VRAKPEAVEKQTRINLKKTITILQWR